MWRRGLVVACWSWSIKLHVLYLTWCLVVSDHIQWLNVWLFFWRGGVISSPLGACKSQQQLHAGGRISCSASVPYWRWHCPNFGTVYNSTMKEKQHQEEHLARKKSCDRVLAWLSVWSVVQMICIWSSWCHCHPIICCFSKIENVLPLWCELTQVVLEKKAIKRMCVCIYIKFYQSSS